MNEHLRDRVLRKLETLSDERAYQVLDYIEFLESKYAERPAPATSIFTRFSEAVEDRLRAGKVSATAIAETMGLMSRAMNVLNGVAAAGRSMASDLERATAGRPGPAASAPSGAPVAGSGTGPGAPAGPPPAGSTGPVPSTDPSVTESGELEPPAGQ